MPKKRGSVAILIINWNGTEDTILCLEDVAQLTYSPKGVYVLDNASRPEKRQDLERWIKSQKEEINFLRSEENTGFAGGAEMLLQRAQADGHDYFFLLNNDTRLPQRDLLERLVNELETHAETGVVGPLIPYPDGERIWFAGGKTSLLTGFTFHPGKGRPVAQVEKQTSFETEFVTGCAFLIRKEALETVGSLYAPFFLYYEDVDWCARAAQAGYAARVVAHAIVRHKKSASSGNEAGSNMLSETQAYYLARNAFLFGRRNLRGWRRVLYLMAQLCVRWPVNEVLFMRSWRSRKSYWRGLYDGIRGREGKRIDATTDGKQSRKDKSTTSPKA